MMCAWQAFLDLLPVWMRQQVDAMGKEDLQELRLRQGMYPALIRSGGAIELYREVSAEDLRFIVNMASRYSPWAATTMEQGYITAPGGHRIGLCGQATSAAGVMTGIRAVTSLCIRIARDFPGIAKGADFPGSMLIIGKPGSGKTTLLRDLVRARSDRCTGAVVVVDEREEIFPYWNDKSCFPPGRSTDVLRGCGKTQGITSVLRSMCPETIAMDEITAAGDCDALLHAGWCGVQLLATAHAGSIADLLSRPVYRPLVEAKLFDKVIVLQKDKTWTVERICHGT